MALVLVMSCWMLPASAHTVGWGYTWLSIDDQQIVAEIQIPVSSLPAELAIDDNPSNAGQLSESQQEIVDEILSEQFTVTTPQGAPYDSLPTSPPSGLNQYSIEHIEGTWYLRLYWKFVPPEGQTVGDRAWITYNLFTENDEDVRHGLIIQNNTRTGVSNNHVRLSYLFAPSRTATDLNLAGKDSWASRLAFFFIEGLHHIWIGLDHILFLLALLVTSVVHRTDKQWQPIDDRKAAIWHTVALITVFTIAHGLTLALALKGWVNLPARWVESIIALSIIVVAIDNMYPIFSRSKLFIVFGFGLFHGLGFAYILQEIALNFEDKLIGIVGFNIGVEVGQVLIALVVVPLFFALRNRAYIKTVLRPVSTVVALIALFWFVERAFEIELLA